MHGSFCQGTKCSFGGARLMLQVLVFAGSDGMRPCEGSKDEQCCEAKKNKLSAHRMRGILFPKHTYAFTSFNKLIILT